MSTRARAQLWKLEEALRATSRERGRLLQLLLSSRATLVPGAHHELWMEFSLADQEYRYVIAQLHTFCESHGKTVSDQ